MKFGIKISQEGFDVKDCEDKDLTLSSELNMLKNAIIGSGNAGNVAHGLAYIPMFFTLVQGTGKGTVIGDDQTSTCDATNLTIGASTKYYIFYQGGS